MVRLVRLGQTDHALLAKILRALQREDARRSDAVLHEELGLELALGEVLEKNAGHFFD